MTDGTQTWAGVSGSADRPKSLQIKPTEYLATLKGVLSEPNKNDEYQVTIAPRNKAVVLTIKLQQLRFFQKSLTPDTPREIHRQLFQRIALRSHNLARDNKRMKEESASLRSLRPLAKCIAVCLVFAFVLIVYYAILFSTCNLQPTEPEQKTTDRKFGHGCGSAGRKGSRRTCVMRQVYQGFEPEEEENTPTHVRHMRDYASA